MANSLIMPSFCHSLCVNAGLRPPDDLQLSLSQPLSLYHREPCDSFNAALKQSTLVRIA